MEPIVELHESTVDLSSLITVLGENLYSTPTVAIRELVQNAHDSIVRRQLESPEKFEPRISVQSNPVERTLSIEDNGAGLTHDEIIRYLATVGSGYTKRLRESTEDPALIGCFGIGFLSAYIVSRRVQLWTASCQEEGKAWRFESTSGEKYSIRSADVRPTGTRITLYLKERFEELADRSILRGLLGMYCSLLKVPVYVEDDTRPINSELPPWRSSREESPARRKKIKLEFAERFERNFTPVATMDLSGADETANGLLWIQDGSTYGTSDNRNVSVFVRGMLISEDARELIPRWAGFVGGVLESDQLVPTASREDLVKDSNFAAVAEHVKESLVRGLSALTRKEPEAWRRILVRHNEALLGAALCEPRLMELLADQLTVPTSEGDVTVPELLKRSQGSIHVSAGTQGGYEEVLFRALKVPVANGTRYAVLPFLKSYSTLRARRLILIGTEQGNKAFFPVEDLSQDVLAWLEPLLLYPGQKLIPSRFAPRELPFVLVPDRDVELKERLESDEADRVISQAALGLARLFTKKVDGAVRAHLYLNLSSPVIERLIQAGPEDGRKIGVLLRITANLMSSPGASGGPDFLQMLQEYCDAMLETLG